MFRIRHFKPRDFRSRGQHLVNEATSHAVGAVDRPLTPVTRVRTSLGSPPKPAFAVSHEPMLPALKNFPARIVRNRELDFAIRVLPHPVSNPRFRGTRSRSMQMYDPLSASCLTPDVHRIVV